MDFEAEKRAWQQNAAGKVAQMVATLDYHLTRCPPKCVGACTPQRCALGAGLICMHRHLLDVKAKLQAAPLSALTAKMVADITAAQAEYAQRASALASDSDEKPPSDTEKP